jgi:hypothetical protein
LLCANVLQLAGGGNSGDRERDMAGNGGHSTEKTRTEARTALQKSTKKSQPEDQEGEDKKSQAAENCECPPGCVGLPCCS